MSEILDKTKPPFIIGERTGSVRLEDFDIAMMNTLDFKIRKTSTPEEFEDVSISVSSKPEGQIVRGYTIIPGINAAVGQSLKDEVNIVFTFPEYVFSLDILPAFVVRRETIDFDGVRATGSSYAYRIGADNAVELFNKTGTVKGFSRLETQQVPRPVDIFYLIDMYAKYRKQLNMMWDFIFRKFSIFDGIYVTDSLGHKRFYATIFQGFSEVSEAIDVGRKIVGYSVVIIVKAELDDQDPLVENTVKEIKAFFENL